MASKTVFVFDLDFTLWDAGGTWCDDTTPPYKNVNKHIVDFNGRSICLYPDVIDILKNLKRRNITIAAASRTTAPAIALEFLERFDIKHFFDILEIYPTGKRAHLSQILKKTKALPANIVFFDDEQRNILDVSKLGIDCELVSLGITVKQVEKYLK